MKRTVKNILGLMVLSLGFMLCQTNGIAEAKKVNNMDEAKKMALQKVGSAVVTEVETDTEHGQTVYEVSLQKGQKEYSLKYRASDGKLIEYEWELPNTSYELQDKENVSEESIRSKAGKKVKDATIAYIRLKEDDGLMEYKVRLNKGNYQYTLVYNAKNAKLLEYEKKYVASSSGSSSNYISEEKAKKIALNKVPGATAVKIKLDHDDGAAVYEVELVKGNYEYEIEIDAKTGNVLSMEKEYDD